MRVICIENSVLIDGNHPNVGGIMAHKGSIYNVIGSIEGKTLRERDGLNYALGPWYRFLELDGLHHHVRFLEIPDDDIELETKTEKNKNYVI